MVIEKTRRTERSAARPGCGSGWWRISFPVSGWHGKCGAAERGRGPQSHRLRTGQAPTGRPGPANDGLRDGGECGAGPHQSGSRGTLVQGRQRVIEAGVHQTQSVLPEEWYVVEGTHCLWSPLVGAGGRAGPAADPPGAGRERSTLAGLLRCADCGRAMSRKTARGIVYYLLHLPQKIQDRLQQAHPAGGCPAPDGGGLAGL